MRKRLTTVSAVAVICVGLPACSSVDGNDGQGDTATQVGPVSFELPDGLDEVFHDDDQTAGWVAEYSDDEDSPGAMVGVWRFGNAPPSASDGAGEMRAQVGAAGTHPGVQISEGGSVEITGADDAYIMDISSGDDDASSLGRWWILVDDDSSVAAVVEFIGLDVGEDELEAFAESLEFNADQGW